jgi:hypothetical protein
VNNGRSRAECRISKIGSGCRRSAGSLDDDSDQLNHSFAGSRREDRCAPDALSRQPVLACGLPAAK